MRGMVLVTAFFVAATSVSAGVVTIKKMGPPTTKDFVTSSGHHVKMVVEPTIEETTFDTPFSCTDNAVECAQAATDACSESGSGAVVKVNYDAIAATCTFSCTSGAGQCTAGANTPTMLMKLRQTPAQPDTQ